MSIFSVLAKSFRRSADAARPEPEPEPAQQAAPVIACPVCHAAAPYLDSVDFNKSCEDHRQARQPASGMLVRYYLCDRCGFCFAPEFASWSFEDFEKRIYNDQYESVDPDYKAIRPLNNAALLQQLFGSAKIRHLDYGGGSGLLSDTLRKSGWDSRSYDPFVDRQTRPEELGTYDLVTAFEVFEHVPDVQALFADLEKLVKPDALILFSTLLSDGSIKRDQALSWWYAAPRNGHISLFSMASLGVCLQQRGFNFSSCSAVLHVAFRQAPDWASHLFPKPPTPA
ncbi:hypothetical protein BH11PSE11_BH11PSE11_00810 [soil metagenome]